MLSKIKVLALAVSAAATAQASPAAAQYMPHLDPNLYMLATMNFGGSQCIAMPEKELIEAREPSRAIMGAYFAAAGGKGAKSAAFKVSAKTKWTAGGKAVTLAAIDQASDPLAAGGNALDAAPLRFYRAGNYSTALGQWAVKNRGGAVAGVYTGLFERERGKWKLRELTVHGADDVVEPVAPYCTKPGDTTQQRVTATANFVASNEKQVARRKARLAAAQSGAATAKGAAARDAAMLVESETKKLAKAEETLGKARENYAEAVADAEEIKRLTLPAREAERLRKAEKQKPS